MQPPLSPEAALLRGWNILPVRLDKKPAIPSWKGLQRRRVSVAEVRDWKRKLKPAGWAVITGALSGLFTLDFDGETGTLTMEKHGFRPHVKTGGGGFHVHVQHPGCHVPTLTGAASRDLARLYPGLDIRGDGGYSIFAGANEAGEYVRLRDPVPEPFESLPMDLQAILRPVNEEHHGERNKRQMPNLPANGRVPSERLMSLALERATGRGRNNAGFWLAAQLRDNGCSQHEAEQIMLDYAARVPSTNTKGRAETYSAAEALASLRQAYLRSPREPWMPDARERLAVREECDPVRSPDPSEEPDLLPQQHNDHGNAVRLISLHGRDIRYFHAIKRWMIWDGRRWRIDEAGRAYKLAKDAMLRFVVQASEAENKDAESFAGRSLDHKRISALLASAECELPITTSDLDRSPYLLNCSNGTLDLRTGKLGQHRREDYITKLAHVDYWRDAKCPLFLQFLHRIMGDGPDASDADGERAGRLVAYLQTALGYSLTGDVSEKVIFCLFGSGNNGKTTLLESVRFVLWEYAAQIQIDTLMSYRQRETNASLSDLADLRGARFVTTSEAEQGGRLAEGKLKYLSAGMGDVKTCRKYENPITFRATHKLFIDANHKPIIRGTDHAIWNRLRLIPFDLTIPTEEIDKGMFDKLKGEAQGILAWMVAGCRRWLAEGLGDSPEVTEASAGWRSEMSLLREFIEDRCELSPQAVCAVGELRRAYEAWARENGEREPEWLRGFDDELIARGCQKKRDRVNGRQARVWRGLSIRANENGEV